MSGSSPRRWAYDHPMGKTEEPIPRPPQDTEEPVPQPEPQARSAALHDGEAPESPHDDESAPRMREEPIQARSAVALPDDGEQPLPRPEPLMRPEVAPRHRGVRSVYLLALALAVALTALVFSLRRADPEHAGTDIVKPMVAAGS